MWQLSRLKRAWLRGGIPIGAALFDRHGRLLGRGRNRRVQQNDPSIHGETDAFRSAGRIGYYGDTTMVSTLAPCLYCSGLIRQFRIGRVVIGEARTFGGDFDWLRDGGVEVTNLDDDGCVAMMSAFIAGNPELWQEDIGTANSGVAIAGVKLVDHPVAQAALTILRDRATGPQQTFARIPYGWHHCLLPRRCERWRHDHERFRRRCRRPSGELWRTRFAWFPCCGQAWRCLRQRVSWCPTRLLALSVWSVTRSQPWRVLTTRSCLPIWQIAM